MFSVFAIKRYYAKVIHFSRLKTTETSINIDSSLNLHVLKNFISLFQQIKTNNFKAGRTA